MAAETPAATKVRQRLNGNSCHFEYYDDEPVASTQTGSDPRTAQQWYLDNTATLTWTTAGEDLRLKNIWQTYKGEGIRIAVLDDGLEVTHNDLRPNVVPGASYNYAFRHENWTVGSAWPLPCAKHQTHGTSVAGIIAARDNNGIGVRGVAPRASLVGYNILASLKTEDILDAMARGLTTNDIYNNSWGNTDRGHFDEAAGGRRTFSAVIAEGLKTGRKGLGAIYVFAAGNGGRQLDYAGYDGHVNTLGVIGVCASNAMGKRAIYSEQGANLLVCAPSGDLRVGNVDPPEVATTAPINDYVTTFSGTSSAAPMVSGVIALMLQANPSLTWRDVRLILAKTARQVDTQSNGWRSRGGYHYHHSYGFGVVDAEAAVTAARSWQSVGGSSTLKQCGPFKVMPNAAIPEINPLGDIQAIRQHGKNMDLMARATGGLVSTLDIPVGQCDIQHIEHVDAQLTARNHMNDAEHPSPGDLHITLTSPSGQTSTLAQPHSCFKNEKDALKPQDPIACKGLHGFSFGLARHLGEPAVSGNNRRWTLEVTDRVAGNTGKLTSWEMTIYGR